MLTKQRQRRKTRHQDRRRGTAEKPRLSVFRSNKYVYAQVINDEKGITLAHASGKVAAEVGEEIAKKAIKNKVSTIVFDRSGYRYHGKVKEIAEGARKGGLAF